MTRARPTGNQDERQHPLAARCVADFPKQLVQLLRVRVPVKAKGHLCDFRYYQSLLGAVAVLIMCETAA